jgi:hypothetical protein
MNALAVIAVLLVAVRLSGRLAAVVVARPGA